MSVTIRAKLPKSDQNGLAHLERTLAAELNKGKQDLRIVVGYVRPDTIELRPGNEDDPRLVKTVLLHVEAVTGDEPAATVDRILRDIYGARTGKEALPFEDDDDDEDDE